MLETVEKFVTSLSESLTSGTFVKLTLGNYKGPDEHLQKINARLIRTKKGTRLFFLYRSDARDTAKNYGPQEGVDLVSRLLGTEFFSGHLFTTEHDFQLDVGRKGKSRLNISRPSFTTAAPQPHNRQKRALVDCDAFYLKALGVTDDSGRVRDRQQDKWRQINKFVEILGSLVDKSELKDRSRLRFIDMGAGKGYLTFAAYDYFVNARGLDVRMTGLDARGELVALCNDLARASEFNGLDFVVGSIAEYNAGDIDILIALHACDTATDDAIYKGIAANAGLIIVAPCCHKEVRPQIKPSEMLSDILKHGVMLERVAETLTDALRALLLERSGYAVKMLEFVPVEHTPKNNMLIGTRLARPANPARFDKQIKELKVWFGIGHQRLDTLLFDRERVVGV
jgi:hypothetical protein